MRKRLGIRGAVVAAVVLVGGGAVALDLIAKSAADRMNKVYRTTPYVATDQGRAMHQRLFIADLHADPLLWNRDLNDRAKTGHVDVPRLIEGNVAIQVFGVVTKTPSHMNPDRNDDKSDDIALLAVAERWPPSTWTSLRARALYEAQRLRDTADASHGKLRLLRSKQDLDAFVAARAKDPKQVGAFLALEGMHALEGDVKNVDVLYDAGFRLLGPAHFFDNDVAGSAHGVNKGGLTELGRKIVARMEEKGMTIDLAHSSAATIDDVLAIATKPVVVSHTGVKGTCDNNRNLSDDQLQRIAANGGVIGIGYWKTATCGTDAAAVAKAIRHAVDVAGVEHVALGSDFDGAVAAPFDAAGLVELTDALLAQGFGEDQLRKIYGENVLRVLRNNLPASP